jgi:hypothetical protein
MDQDELYELDYSITRALRYEFDNSSQIRQIEIYRTTKKLKYEEAAEEMRSDILSDHNIILD